jgi:RNA polymerase sigma-70 factor, ECF subfamily
MSMGSTDFAQAAPSADDLGTAAPPGTDTELEGLQRPLRGLREQFDDLVEPVREDLFRYCLRLTGSPFDAEDLCQDVLLRSFGRLAQLYQPVDARRYLFRIATNAWIDEQRRAARRPVVPLLTDDLRAPTGVSTDDMEDALLLLADALGPRQRAALLLKDVFGFSLAEIAEFLATSEGAVKALLHRARGRVEAARDAVPEHGTPWVPESARRLAEAYAARLSAQDWDGIAALLRADATAVIVGVDEEHGRDHVRRTSLADAATDVLPGQRAEVALVGNEPVVLRLFRPDPGSPDEVVRDVVRLRTDGAWIVRTVQYWYCPEVIEAVASQTGRRPGPEGVRRPGGPPAIRSTARSSGGEA